MTRKASTRAQAVADCIQKRLDDAGIHAETEITTHKDSVTILSVNAHPDEQRIITRIAAEHQSARSDIRTDSWDHSNWRDDIPQTTWVHHSARYTVDFRDRLNEVVAELAPHTHSLEMDLRQTLFKGTRPQFWTQELGGPQPYRCTYCLEPIDDVNALLPPYDQVGEPMRHARCPFR